MSDRRSTPNRRRVLIGLAALAGALGAGSWLRSLAGSRRQAREGAERLFLSCFPRRSKIQPLGRLYLEANPSEADREILVERLLADVGTAARLGNDAALRAGVLQLVRQDFAAGHTQRLGGWILSRTEGRLAALVALSPPVSTVR